jgi:tape measure domain-containing protein
VNEAGSVLIKFEADTAKFRADLEKIKAGMGGVEEQTKQTASVLSGFRSVLAGLAVGEIAKGLFSTALELDRVKKGLVVATGSTQAAAQEFEYIRGISEALGLELASTAQQYTFLAVAAKGTSLEGQGVRDIFEGVAMASSALGLSAEQTAGALNAIQQMISKGTVSAEELRGQLGERLPGAFNLAATAMNVTTQELGNMLERGEVLASDLLPKLSVELKKLGEAAGTGAAAEVARANKEWTELQAALMDNGGTSIAIGALKNFTGWLDVTGRAINFLGQRWRQYQEDLKLGDGDADVGLLRRVESEKRLKSELSGLSSFFKSRMENLRAPLDLRQVEQPDFGDKYMFTQKPRARSGPSGSGTGAPSGGSAASRARKEAEDISATFDKIMAESRQRATEMLKDLTDAQLQMAIDANDLAFKPMTDRIDGIAMAWSSVKDSAVDALSQIIFKGGEASEIVGQLLQMLASEVFKAAWSGDTKSVGGGIISAVSDFFGGILGRAGGGPVNRGQPYMVGESGPELFVPSASGRILRNGSGGGGQGVVVNQSFVFEGVNAATVSMLRSEAGRIADQVRREVAPIMVNAQRRNQLAGAF